MTDIQMLQKKGMLKTFQFSFDELHIKSDTVDDFIGFSPGEAPEPFPEIISEIMSTASKLVSPLGGYLVSGDVRVYPEKKQTAIGEVFFSTENIVTRHMDNAEKIAVFACTAGAEITSMAADYNRRGQIMHAYIADSLGSIIMGKTMDIISESLGIYMRWEGMKITNRYSPGYCGWPVSEREKVLRLLPADFCGISIPETGMIKPVKSACGFIGIGKQVLYDQHTCHYCRDVNCIYCGKK